MKIVQANGNWREIGRQVGESTREEIRQAREFVLEAVREHGGWTDPRAIKDYTGWMLRETATRYRFAGDFLSGLKEGSGASSMSDIALTAFSEELLSNAGIGGEKCSTIVVPSKEGWILGHNEDYSPFYLGRLFILKIGRQSVSLNYPGQLPCVGPTLSGNNAFSCNSLIAESRMEASLQARFMAAHDRIDYYLAIEALAGQCSLPAHFTLVSGVPRSNPVSIEIANKHVAETETSIEDIYGPYFHTNHSLRIKFKEGMEHPTASSYKRFAELEGRFAKGRVPATVEDVKSFMSEPDGVLCKTPMDDMNSCTLASVVIRPATGEYWIKPRGENSSEFIRLTP